jgi:hypothetical protein
MASKRTTKTAQPRERDWRVSIIRKKMQFLGRVRAVDKATAAATAASEFGLTDQERGRLVIDQG